jgi:hypothetical protein
LTDYPGVASGYQGDPVGVVQATFNAESGPANYASGTCSNVSCHGGQTVNWNTGNSLTSTAFAGLTELTDSANCNNCHAPSLQFNSYASGQLLPGTTTTLHQFHLAQPFPFPLTRAGNIICTDCHAAISLGTPSPAPLHFATLSVPIPTTAYLTVGNSSSPVSLVYTQPIYVNGVNTNQLYGDCTTACHPNSGTNANWFKN